MLNAQYAPDGARLMLQLSSFGQRQLGAFSWGALEGSVFLPRIQYKRIILRPAEWRFRPDLDSSKTDLSHVGAFALRVDQWRATYKVPKSVYMVQADNRLLLDLEDEGDVDVLRTEANKVPEGLSLLLQEPIPSLDDGWARSDAGRHIVEAACSLVLRGDSSGVRTGHANSDERQSSSSTSSRSSIKPVFHVGSDWLFGKFYLSDSAAQDVLVDVIQPFAGTLMAEGVLDQWFFVRFADPDPHLRLRFHVDNAQSAPGELMKRVARSAYEWAEHGVIERYTFESYIAESTRYGGTESLDCIHRLFNADSEHVCNLFALGGTQDAVSPLHLALLSLDSLMSLFHDDIESKVRWLTESMPRPVEAGGVFRENKEELRRILSLSSDDDETFTYSSAFQSLESRLDEMRSRLAPFVADRWSLHERSRILGSILHMHCNRFFGIDRTREKLCYGILQYTLRSLQEFPYARS